jgi:xanthine dehydrogenase accessory factor
VSLDLPQIVRCAANAPGPLFLATVVRTDGPCYRRVGARMLVGSEGRLAGGVSGGCLERDLVRRIDWLVKDGSRVVRFDTGADGDTEDAPALGCGGTVDVLLERLDPTTRELLEWVDAQAGARVIGTRLSSPPGGPKIGARFAAARGRSVGDFDASWSAGIDACLEARTHRELRGEDADGAFEFLIEYVPPPRHLLVAARHYDAAPLVDLARRSGWSVTLATDARGPEVGVADRRIGLEADAVSAWMMGHPEGAVVIMTHSVPLDRRCLELALAGRALPYVGVLGPRDRTRDLIDALIRRGAVPPGADDRLRSPVGLDLGSEGPVAIALSIVAELEQAFTRRIPVVTG